MQLVKIDIRYLKRILQGLFFARSDVRRYCDGDEAVLSIDRVLCFDLAQEISHEGGCDLLSFDVFVDMGDSDGAIRGVIVVVDEGLFDL